jgi:hypothetical protein
LGFYAPHGSVAAARHASFDSLNSALKLKKLVRAYDGQVCSCSLNDTRFKYVFEINCKYAAYSSESLVGRTVILEPKE